MIRESCVWLAAVAMIPGAAAAPPAIERLAPSRSLFVAGSDNAGQTMDRLKATSMWQLWGSKAIQDLLADVREEWNEGKEDLLQELGLEEDSLVTPRGPVGIAVFPGAAADQSVSLGFLAMADFAGDADKFGSLADAMIGKMQEEDVEVKEEEVLGRTVYTFDLAELELEDAIDAAQEELPDEFQEPLPDPMDLVNEVKQVHYVRDGTLFLLCSDSDALRDALEVLGGEDRASVRDREDYRAARRQIGEADAWAVLLARDLPQLLGGGDPSALMTYSMIQSILGDIKAMGFGMRAGGPAAEVEKTLTLYMPNGTGGLTALTDTELPRRDLPPFVGPDAVGYTAGSFEFTGIMDFLRGLGRTNPMMAPPINELLFEHGATIQQVCAVLGPEVHSVVTLSRPIRLDSMKALYAIQSRDPAQVEGVLAQHAPEIGLEPRDFLGHRIYTLPMNPLMRGMGGMGGGGQTFSIGFGGGFVMLGDTSLVEDALRVAGKSGMPTLASDPEYRRALQALRAPRAVAWGVVDLVDYVEYFKDFNTMVEQDMIAQMKQWDPEFAQEMQAELDAEPAPPWADFDVNLLREHLGPMSWEIRAAQDGFVAKYYLLAPTP